MSAIRSALDILAEAASAMRAKMNLPKERCLSSNTFGVYPNHYKLPSSLCCFRIMQLRTGVVWLAYGEMVWITSQLSYWAAQAVTNGFPQAVIMIGFFFTFSQIVFVLFLLKGVKQFRSSFIACYLCGLVARIILYLIFLMLIGFVNLAFVWDEDDETSLIFFRTKVPIKVTFCVFYTTLKIYLFVVIYRFYSYIVETTAYFRGEKQSPLASLFLITLVALLEIYDFFLTFRSHFNQIRRRVRCDETFVSESHLVPHEYRIRSARKRRHLERCASPSQTV